MSPPARWVDPGWVPGAVLSLPSSAEQGGENRIKGLWLEILLLSFVSLSLTPLPSCTSPSYGAASQQRSTEHFFPRATNRICSPRETFTSTLHRPPVPNRFLILGKSCIMSSWSGEVGHCPVIAPKGLVGSCTVAMAFSGLFFQLRIVYSYRKF